MLIGLSAILATALLFSIYHLSLIRSNRAATYRLFLLLYFAVWSAVFWVKPHEPSVSLMLVCIVFLGILPILAFIPRRVPKNRRQTKAMLEQIQKERRLHKAFGSRTKLLFWTILWCLICSVCYRLISIFHGGISWHTKQFAW
jgi:hypothetical protein